MAWDVPEHLRELVFGKYHTPDQSEGPIFAETQLATVKVSGYSVGRIYPTYLLWEDSCQHKVVVSNTLCSLPRPET